MRRTAAQPAALLAVLVCATGATLYFSVLASARPAPVGTNGTITANVNGTSDQSGLNTTSVVNGSSANAITFVYTTASASTTSEVTIVVPSGWSTPQTSSSGTAGYVALGACPNGSVNIAGGQTIDVTFSVPLASSTSCAVTYGSGSNAAAPSTNVGAQTWTSSGDSGGGLTALDTQPQINVLSANGSGTMQISPTSTKAASTGNTYTLTYFAGTGGLSSGALRVVVPAGFSAPSTTPADPGYTTTDCGGTVGASGQDITVSNISFTAGACSITYGSKTGGGPGATAGSTFGANSFDTEEQSGSGSLTSLAASPTVFVTPDHFSVTDSLGGGHATAGTAFDVTVTAKDASGTTMTAYTGTVDFSTSDNSISASVPSAYTFSGGDNGTHTFSDGVVLATAGAQTVTATDDAYNSVTGTDNVTVDPTGATHFALNGTTTIQAGTLDQLTLSARDPYGNIATSYTGSKSITFSGAAGSGSGTQPFIYDAAGTQQSVGGAISVTFSAGIATSASGGASADQLKIFLPAAVTNDVDATDGTLTSNTLAVDVTPGAATHFSLTNPGGYTAGDTHDITVYALDGYGNVDTSYDSGSGCTALTWSGAGTSPGGYIPTSTDCAADGGGEADFGDTSYAAFSAGVATVPITLYDWQYAFPAVTDGTISSSSSPQIGVDPAATDHLVVAGSGTQTTGQSQDLTITAADLYGNQEPAYNGEHDLTFGGADNAPDGTQPTITDDAGTAVDAFSGAPVALTFNTGVASAGAGTGAGQLHMKLYDAESATITVSDGTYSGSLDVTANPSLDHFEITGPSTATAGVPFTATITAYDAYENVVHSYNNDGDGCFDLTMSGADPAPSGTAPTAGGCGSNGTGPQPLGVTDSYRFAGPPFGPGGVETTTVTLYDAETAHLKITDGTHGTPDAGALAVDVSPASAAQFGVTHVPTKVSQNGAFSVTTSALDTYENLTTTSGDEHYALSTTDGTGTLGGTTTGTILSGNSSDTLTGVTYDTQETIHLRATGDLSTSAASSPINVDSPDGSGTMVPLTSHVVPGSSGNELSFEYTPATSMDNGSVSLVVPNDWPAPSTNSNDPGYTKTGCSSCSHAGDVGVSGQTITVTNIQTNQPIYIQYGDQSGGGPGATAPSTSGGETWTASSREDSASGSLQPLATSPTVYVDSPDGSGTLGVSSNLIAGSTGNDETLTYTAGTGGLGGGSITIAHPSGWTAFSAASTDTSDCSGCTVSYPGGNLELDNVTLASGQQLTIDYTTDAPQVAATTSFATQEASSSGGTLGDLAAAQQVHVYPAALSHYGIAASASQTAGGEQGLIVVAQDEYGNLESSGPNDVSGDVSLTFSGADTAPDGTSAPTVTDKNGDPQAFGDSTTVTFSHGEAEGDGTQLDMTLYDAEAASIGVTDGTTSSLAGYGITVSSASFSGFTLKASGGGTIGTQRSGVSFQAEATAVDAYDNTETGYAGTVDFSTSDSACDSGCATNVGDFSNGVLTHSFTLDRSGPGVTVSVAEHSDSSKNGTSNSFLLVPAGFQLVLGGVGAHEAGNSEDLTVTAKDYDGTTATSYAGTVEFSTSDSGASTSVPVDYTFNGGDNGVHTFSNGVTLTTAGNQTVTATDTSVEGLTGTAVQNIAPADPSHVSFTSNANDVAEGATKTLTAELLDPYDNLVDSNATVTFAQSNGTGSVTGLGDVSAVHGVATDVVTGALAGSVTVTASSGVLSTDTSSFTVLPGAPTKLAFTSSTADLASGTSRTLTAQVEDADGNLVPTSSYHVTIAKLSGAGTVSLGPSSAGGGITSRPATGVLAGPITIQATAGGLTSAATTFDVVPGTAAKLAFTSPTANLVSGDSRSLTVEIKDAAGNVVTSDGGHSVTLAKVGGVGTVTGLGTTPSAAGVASRSVTGYTAGSIVIKASAGGLAPATTTFKIVSGEAAKLVFTSSSGALGLHQRRNLSVEVEDAAGNLVKSPPVVVTFAVCSGAGTASGLPQSPTSANGKASARITATGLGAISICATADGLTTGTSSFRIVRR